MLFNRIPPSGNGLSPLRFLARTQESFPEALSALRGLPSERMLFASSGTAALYLALRGMQALEPARREVVLPAWCCPSVPQAVMQAGLVPVPVDLDPDTLLYSQPDLDRRLSEDTLCLLLVHFFGIPPPLPPMPAGAPPFILRDCAQDFNYAPPAHSREPFFYSFGRGKSLNTGHGGALCFPEPSPLLDACREALDKMDAAPASPLAKMLALTLLSHPIPFWALSQLAFLSIGQTRWEHPLEFHRIHPSFHRWGTAFLKAFESCRSRYAALVRDYTEIISNRGRGRVAMPYTGYSEENVPIRFPIRVTDPALCRGLYGRLNSRYGGLSRQYPDILHRLPGCPAGFPAQGEFPGGTRISRELLTLPVTAWLGGRQEAFLADLGALLDEG